MGLVRRLVVAEADVAVGPEHLGRPELPGELVDHRLGAAPARARRRRPCSASSRSWCCPPPGPRRRPGPRRGSPRSSRRAPAVVGVVVDEGVPADLAQRRRRRCPASGPSRRAPTRPTRRSRRRPGPVSSSHVCRRAAPPSRARSATAASSRLPCPRRPQRGSTSRVETSVVGPGGIRPLVRRTARRGRRPRSRRRLFRSSATRTPWPGVGGVLTAACQLAVAAASSHSSSRSSGSTRAVRRPPGDGLDARDLRRVRRAGRPHRGVGRPGQAGERRGGVHPGSVGGAAIPAAGTSRRVFQSGRDDDAARCSLRVARPTSR